MPRATLVPADEGRPGAALESADDTALGVLAYWQIRTRPLCMHAYTTGRKRMHQGATWCIVMVARARAHTSSTAEAMAQSGLVCLT